MHQIPSNPTYFRAKIGRRLKQVGAIPIKQAVYALPDNEQSLEDFMWIAKEIDDQGGEAIVLNANFLEGLDDDQVIGLFEKARHTDYETLLDEACALMDEYHSCEIDESRLSGCRAELRKLKKTYHRIAAIDFFPGTGQMKTEAYLDEMETIFHETQDSEMIQTEKTDTFSGRVWVTKRNVYVDRMASAWFILRFIDQNAHFKFIDQTRYTPQNNELRFDMREAEYTHQGEMCTFEVLVQTFRPNDRGLLQIAKLIHDIDLKDDSFGLPEKAGVQAIIDSIVATNDDDLSRIQQANAIFDGLLVNYSDRTLSKEK